MNQTLLSGNDDLVTISNHLSTSAGAFEISLAEDWAQHGETVAELALKWGERRSGQRASVAGIETVLKGGPLSHSGARRHRLRRLFLGRPAPAAEEFSQLAWLRERLFQVPRPLAAVTMYRGAKFTRLRRPMRQLLITEEVPGAIPLHVAIRAANELSQLRWSRELGRELGRMHALRFLHADLFPRNVLVTPKEPGDGSRELWFIDCWAGGPTAWRNGALRPVVTDLGAWLAEAEAWLDAPYLDALLGSYVVAREANGRPVRSRARWLTRVERSRRNELRRRETQRYRLRGLPFPRAGVVLRMPAAPESGPESGPDQARNQAQ